MASILVSNVDSAMVEDFRPAPERRLRAARFQSGGVLGRKRPLLAGLEPLRRGAKRLLMPLPKQALCDPVLPADLYPPSGRRAATPTRSPASASP